MCPTRSAEHQVPCPGSVVQSFKVPVRFLRFEAFCEEVDSGRILDGNLAVHQRKLLELLYAPSAFAEIQSTMYFSSDW